jgi:hypothetical protein
LGIIPKTNRTTTSATGVFLTKCLRKSMCCKCLREEECNQPRAESSPQLPDYVISESELV